MKIVNEAQEAELNRIRSELKEFQQLRHDPTCDTALKISPVNKDTPNYPSLAAAIACGATLALSSCECSACGGSGLHVRTAAGFGPNPGLDVSSISSRVRMPKKPRLCEVCGGTGNDYWFSQPQPQPAEETPPGQP